METVYPEDTGVLRLDQLSGFKDTRPGMNKRSRMHSGSFFDFCEISEEDVKGQADLNIPPQASQFLAELKGKDVFISSGKTFIRGSGLFRSQSFPLEGWQKAARKCIVKISRTSTITGVQGHLLKILGDNHVQSLKGSRSGYGDECTAEVTRNLPLSVPPLMSEVIQQQPIQVKESKKHIESPEGCQFNSEVCLEKACLLPVKAPPSPERLKGNLTSIQTVLGSERQDEGLDKGKSPDISSKAAGVVEVEKLPFSGPPKLYATKGHCPPCGKLLVCGRRREMEDTVAIVPSFAALLGEEVDGPSIRKNGVSNEKHSALDLHFFGVYDGHGGSQASIYCMDKLHLLLAEELKAHSRAEDLVVDSADICQSKWANLLKACFLKMDKEVGGVCPSGVCDDDVTDSTCTSCGDAIAPGNVGTTALVAVVGSSQIVVANCGDSRAVLSRGGNAIPLSRDHKPERDDETSRIEAAGGRVICWDGYRVGGLLALSRAIGDRYLKRYVISEPEVTCTERFEDDEFLILATDGLWDVINNDYACDVVRKSLMVARRKREAGVRPSPSEDPASASVAALLVKLAYNKGSKDNISVVVVDLKANS